MPLLSVGHGRGFIVRGGEKRREEGVNCLVLKRASRVSQESGGLIELK